MEQVSPSLTVLNPCGHRRMKNWSLLPAVQVTQTLKELAALSLGDCISMSTDEGFYSFIKTSDSTEDSKRPREFSVTCYLLPIRG